MSDMDRPLPLADPLHTELRLALAPRQDPSAHPRPAANGDLDEEAVRRAARLLDRIVG